MNGTLQHLRVAIRNRMQNKHEIGLTTNKDTKYYVKFDVEHLEYLSITVYWNRLESNTPLKSLQLTFNKFKNAFGFIKFTQHYTSKLIQKSK